MTDPEVSYTKKIGQLCGHYNLTFNFADSQSSLRSVVWECKLTIIDPNTGKQLVYEGEAEKKSQARQLASRSALEDNFLRLNNYIYGLYLKAKALSKVIHISFVHKPKGIFTIQMRIGNESYQGRFAMQNGLKLVVTIILKMLCT